MVRINNTQYNILLGHIWPVFSYPTNIFVNSTLKQDNRLHTYGGNI